MRRIRSARLALAAATAAAGTLLAATPAEGSITVPMSCGSLHGEETVLAWDDVTYELSGTCGVVRVTGDRATVSMSTARRLVVEGADVVVQTKPLSALEVTGDRATVTATSVTSLALGGTASSVVVTGLLEDAAVTGHRSSLAADRVHSLRLTSGAATVDVRKVYDLSVSGDDNTVALRRAGDVVVTGDRNTVTVDRGRTAVRDDGTANAVRVHRRR